MKSFETKTKSFMKIIKPSYNKITTVLEKSSLTNESQRLFFKNYRKLTLMSANDGFPKTFIVSLILTTIFPKTIVNNSN